MSLERKKMAAEVSNASVQTSFRASRQATLIAGALIMAAVLAAYSNTFSVPFTLGDESSIIENTAIRHLWPIHRVLSPPGGAITVSGRPVLNLSLALNYALSGTKVWSYHALNLAIHILASLTLFGIVRRTLLAPLWRNRFENSALPLALAVALLWALHPLQTEAVTYVIQRAESLMGLFYLLTLYCFIRAALGISNLKFQISNTAGPRPISNLKFQISNTAGPRPISNLKSQISNLWFVLCIAACLLGMGTKEVMVSAPLMVLLYDRTFGAGTFGEALRRRWGLYAGLAATWLVLVADSGAQNSDLNATISPWHYALTQSWAIVHYLRLVIWPHPLVFDYGQFLIRSPVDAAPWALIVVALVVGTIVSLRRWPAIGFLGSWFFAILAPTSSVMPLAGQTVAEHRMYLPLAGVLALMVISAYRLGMEGIAGLRFGSGNSRTAPPELRPTGLVLSTVLVLAALALLMVTAQRNEIYRSEERLWSDTVAKRPNNPRAHNGLGIALARSHQYAQAITEYHEALSLEPDYAQAHNNLGNALLDQGRIAEAISHFQRALEIMPDNPEAQYHLGNALLQSGRADAAIACYQKALALKPQLAEAHNNFGIALFSRGRLTEAIAQWTQASALQPGNADAQNNLAWTLATCPDGALRDGPKAVQLALRAVQLTSGRNPAYLGTLAAAYAESGRLAEAVSTAQKALELAQSQTNAALAGAIKTQLDLHLAGLPFRDASQTNATAGRKN